VCVIHITNLISSDLISSSEPTASVIGRSCTRTGSLNSARPGLPWLRPITVHQREVRPVEMRSDKSGAKQVL